MSEYSANDIKTLTPGQGYRERIGMYLSADLQEAMDLGLRELVYNAQDEYAATGQKGAYIKITINSTTNEIIAEDNLRGIPCEIREDGINSLTAAFLIPHSGAKYDDKTAYASSVGCNGQGMKVVCHTSKWLKAEIKRDGKIYFQSFHETPLGAEPDEDVKVIGESKETGTKITYIPSEIVYGKDTRINIDVLSKTLQELAYFSRGLKIILVVDNCRKEFLSNNGLIDGLNTSNGLSKPFQYFYNTNDCEVELALQWVSKRGKIRGYANGLEMVDGGKFITSFKSSLTRTFNSLAKTKFDGEQIRGVLDGYVSVKVRVGQFSNQSKTSLANPEAGTATSTAISECLKEFASARPEDFNKVVELLTKLEKAEKAADKAREAVLNHTKEVNKELKKKTVLAGKLADCRYHDEKSQLLIVEGLSALGGIVKSRNSDYTAAIPLTGKIQNVFKNSEDKLLENQVLKNLHTALGCGFGKDFNLKKLRYGRVVFVCDSDEDGYSIMCLLMAFMYKYYPQLIEMGKVFWGQTPLFKILTKTKTYYAYTDSELATLPKGDITRAKGIGELEPEDFKATLFSSEGRYIPFTMNDAAAASEYFDLLLGENVENRRAYISENADFDAFD